MGIAPFEFYTGVGFWADCPGGIWPVGCVEGGPCAVSKDHLDELELGMLVERFGHISIATALHVSGVMEHGLHGAGRKDREPHHREHDKVEERKRCSGEA